MQAKTDVSRSPSVFFVFMCDSVVKRLVLRKYDLFLEASVTYKARHDAARLDAESFHTMYTAAQSIGIEVPMRISVQTQPGYGCHVRYFVGARHDAELPKTNSCYVGLRPSLEQTVGDACTGLSASRVVGTSDAAAFGAFVKDQVSRLFRHRIPRAGDVVTLETTLSYLRGVDEDLDDATPSRHVHFPGRTAWISRFGSEPGQVWAVHVCVRTTNASSRLVYACTMLFPVRADAGYLPPLKRTDPRWFELFCVVVYMWCIFCFCYIMAKFECPSV